MSLGKELVLHQTIISKALYVLGELSEEALKKILTPEELKELPNVKEQEMTKLVLLEKGIEK